MIKTIIIDLDDTLAAFDVVTKPSWKQVCGDFCRGRDIDPGQLYDDIMAENRLFWSDHDRHRIGRQNNPRTRRLILDAAFFQHGYGTKQDAWELADMYSRVRMENMFLFPGACELLKQLRQDGYTLVLMTNGDGPTQRSKIDRFQLEPYFDLILVEGELGYGKPDPRVFQKAFDFSGTGPQESLIVGDNLRWEIGVPNEMGMTTVWMNYTGRKERKDTDPLPDKEIHQLKELLPFLETLKVSA